MARKTIRQEQLNTPESLDLSRYVAAFKELVQARYPTATFYLAPGLEENTWHLNIFAPVEDDLELEGQLSEKATDFLVFDDVAISPIFLPQRTLDGLTDTEHDHYLYGTPKRADG